MCNDHLMGEVGSSQKYQKLPIGGDVYCGGPVGAVVQLELFKEGDEQADNPARECDGR